MIDDEHDYLDMAWPSQAEPTEQMQYVPVYASCPACYGMSCVGKIELMEEPAERLALEPLSDDDLQRMLQNDMFVHSNLCLNCGAYLEVNSVTRTVSLEPALSILSWMDEGRVPIGATLGVWPTRWFTPQSEGGHPISYQQVLEALHLTGDTRLKALISRCASHGNTEWKRIGREAWEPKAIDTTRDCNDMIIDAVESEFFESSLAAVCPSPPPIELVVAAVERAQKEGT